jgi:hypothetical protein
MTTLIRKLVLWLRLAFCFWTHKPYRIGPGLYLQRPRSMSDRDFAAALRRGLAAWEQRRKGETK